jgi:YD repeat-containing protein
MLPPAIVKVTQSDATNPRGFVTRATFNADGWETRITYDTGDLVSDTDPTGRPRRRSRMPSAVRWRSSTPSATAPA